VILFVGGIICISMLFISRVLKSIDARKVLRLKPGLQKLLNTLIVNETFSAKATPEPAFRYWMNELEQQIGNSRFSRQILINVILDLKKNITGNVAEVLKATYYAHSLHHDSLAKLKSVFWKNKAMGIRELAEMGYQDAILVITRFARSSNQTLREESVMALVRLESEPLSFLNTYKGEITPWMRINIHQFLQKMDVRKLPLFNRWFNHNNVSIVLFSISMARHFRQSAVIPDLVKLLTHADQRIISASIDAIGELDAYACGDEVAQLSVSHWNDEKLCLRIARCLGKIGDPEAHAAALLRMIDHPSHDVRFEAVHALKKLGVADFRILSYNTGDRRIQNIIAHLSEPLLQ
jgi:HEAT repeat protein